MNPVNEVISMLILNIYPVGLASEMQLTSLELLERLKEYCDERMDVLCCILRCLDGLTVFCVREAYAYTAMRV